MQYAGADYSALLDAHYLDQFGRFVQKPGDIPYEASTALGAIGSVEALLGKRPAAPRS